MLITHRLQLDTPRPVALALGTFDGLHLGHRAVIDQVLQGDFIPAVLTFDGHPRQVLEHKQPPLLQTAADKYALLEEWGVKAVFSLDFASIRDLSPEDFLHMLCTRLPVGRLCCGFNFRFGRNAKFTCKIFQNAVRNGQPKRLKIEKRAVFIKNNSLHCFAPVPF